MFTIRKQIYVLASTDEVFEATSIDSEIHGKIYQLNHGPLKVSQIQTPSWESDKEQAKIANLISMSSGILMSKDSTYGKVDELGERPTSSL